MSENIDTKEVNKQAWDFFVFATLGIAPGDNEDVTIKKCIRSAYLDMNRTLIIKDNTNIDDADDPSCTFYKVYSGKMYDAINNHLSCISRAKQQCYEVFFKNGELLEGIGDYLDTRDIKDQNKRQGQPFYYGQAQKWINMTFKYLWLLGKIDDKELEIPIDSFIMKKAWEQFKIELPRDNKSNSYKEYSSSSTMPWSKLSKEEYEKLRDDLNSKIDKTKSPLTWENETWIAANAKND